MEYHTTCIIPDRVLQTRKQSGVRRILKVCKESVRVSAVNTLSQDSVRNNSTCSQQFYLAVKTIIHGL